MTLRQPPAHPNVVSEGVMFGRIMDTAMLVLAAYLLYCNGAFAGRAVERYITRVETHVLSH